MFKNFLNFEKSTAHRIILDRLLKDSEKYIKGRVLDIGGKKVNKRGNYKPPLKKVKKWEYLNIDKSTEPDYLCSAENIPIGPNSIDTILICELLEHVKNPEKVLEESIRILKPHGKIIISMPFLFPIHTDPSDYQRFTGSKFKIALEELGIKILEIKAMGYYFSVLNDFFLIAIQGCKRRYLRKFFLLLFKGASVILYRLDKKIISGNLAGFTTGFYLIGEKLN